MVPTILGVEKPSKLGNVQMLMYKCKISVLRQKMQQQHGAVEARGAHNPEVT
jgi:hypothetical protein